VVVGLPGAAYLSALHNLVAGKYSTATQIVAVFVFVIIELLLIIIPWLCLEFWPTGTAVRLKRAQDWLTGHVAQLLGWICILLGAYLTISAAVRLS
jgi:Sap, sulfolipid-1-addressing protein